MALQALKRRLPSSTHHHHHHLLLSRLHFLHRNSNPQNPNPENPNPYDLMKDDPIDVLSNLWLRSFKQPPSPFPNLTGFLKNFSLWVLAYQRSVAHHTGSFPPKSSIPRPHLLSLLSLRSLLLLSSPRAHRFGSVTHLALRSPSDPPRTKPLSKRKFRHSLLLSPPPFQDRVVQELLLSILEPVFEPRFSRRSHAWRPGRSPHTVLRTVRSDFAGYLWFVKADLTPISDSLDPELVLSCLAKGFTDRKVLSVVKSALVTPVRSKVKADEDDSKLARKRMKRKVLRKKRRKKVLDENEPKPDPYWLRTFFGFAPEEAARVPDYGHCGILSPLLANVCLDELDKWMEGRIEKYFRPSRLDSIWKESMDDGCHNPAWPEFVPASGREKTRKMDYVRYGSHILVGIRGPREDAVEIKKELVEFLEEKFGSKLDNSHIEIEHVTRGIEFLDHIICRRVIYPTLRYTATGGKVVSEKGIGTLLSVTANMHKCISQFRQLELVKGDRDPEPLPCTPMLYAGQAHTNSQMNKFLEAMADWYRYADNRKKVVGFCAYVVRSSLAKLYAARYRLKSRAKVYKIAARDLSRPLRENTRNDAPEYSDLLRMGLVDAIDGVQFSHMSMIPSCDYTPFPRNWVPDHERVLRDYIKLQDPKFFCELHKLVKQQDLSSPQDDLSKIVWNYKVCGVHDGRRAHEYIKHLENSDEDINNNRISAIG